ncbi:hypothetical protein QTH97_02335 [Variovorax sp. J22R24]|uniref:hypothetical protein n=1 Tax=Variovorax gracilis TaxID=3053502 RepID=UPI0025766798|nr:hypothetical protein [Variovorax sp. J22R24]MDM0103755.1 hypothetical protein [Variovorax sp. J22R24]
MSEYLTTKEVAALLRTTPGALHVAYNKRKSYLPPRYRFGKRILYKRDEVIASLRLVEQ